jgi:hypothetical protein
MLWNPNIHYRVDESHVSILSQINPDHDRPSYSLKILFNILLPYDIIQEHFAMSHALPYSETVFRDGRQYSDHRNSNLQ